MGDPPISGHPWNSVVMDFLGPLPPSDGYQYVLVIMDDFTRYVELTPCKAATADAVVEALECVFLRHGISPPIFQSDNGSHFANAKLAALAAKYGFTQRFSEPHRPQTNGIVERANWTIVRTIMAYIERHSARWAHFIRQVQFHMNTFVSSSLGMSPHSALYGVTPRTHVVAKTGIPPVSLDLAALHDVREAQREKAHDNLLAARRVNKTVHDRAKRDVAYAVGDTVLVRSGNTKRSKLDPEWDGPMRVVGKKHDLAYNVHDPIMDRTFSAHVNNMRRFDMTRTSPEAQQRRHLSEDFYVVDDIINHRQVGHRLELLVKYEGYDEPEWQDASPMTRLDKFKAYVAKNGLKRTAWAATSASKAAAKARKAAPKAQTKVK